ncbi:hypothetical protein [Streptomyces halstedii]|uniref:hypothetical protein n=1 Tax=Streptomyces halstedii TaxID=1944 RepID=UPI0033A547C8
MHGLTPLRISVALATVAAVMGTGVAFAGSSSDTARPTQASAPAAADTTALTQRFIVGYKSQAEEARSNAAIVKDAKAKGERDG